MKTGSDPGRQPGSWSEGVVKPAAPPLMHMSVFLLKVLHVSEVKSINKVFFFVLKFEGAATSVCTTVTTHPAQAV